MQLGDIANHDAARYGKPLDGVRILAAEQMQALPYATQLLARLGAEVVKVEHPVARRVGPRRRRRRCSTPTGRRSAPPSCATTSTSAASGIDLKSPRAASCSSTSCRKFDVVAENFKAGTMDRLGLGYDDVADRPPARHLRVGVGLRQRCRRDLAVHGWPAYASVVEAMSGIYEYRAAPTTRRPPSRSARSATSARPCSPSSASSPRCATATGPAWASTSTSPCSTPWSP